MATFPTKANDILLVIVFCACFVTEFEQCDGKESKRERGDDLSVGYAVLITSHCSFKILFSSHCSECHHAWLGAKSKFS